MPQTVLTTLIIPFYKSETKTWIQFSKVTQLIIQAWPLKGLRLKKKKINQKKKNELKMMEKEFWKTYFLICLKL